MKPPTAENYISTSPQLFNPIKQMARSTEISQENLGT